MKIALTRRAAYGPTQKPARRRDYVEGGHQAELREVR